MNGRYDDTMEHLGERAELYALGVLDADEAERANAHAARCVGCAAALGAAERAMTALDDAFVPLVAAPDDLGKRIRASAGGSRRRPALRGAVLRFGALAAGFALLVAGTAGTREFLHLRTLATQDDAILATVATSHFKHATFAKSDPAAPAAKVLWGLGRGWIYVIVNAADCNCRVIVTTSDGERDLGAPVPRGRTSATFARDLPPVRRVELRRDGTVTESADIR